MATPTPTLDPQAVIDALLANAQVIRAAPAATPFYDPDKILDALYKNAELLHAQSEQSNRALLSHAVSLAQGSQGYVSYHLLSPNAPLTLPIVTGVISIFTAFVFLFSGAISTRWGSSVKVNDKRLLQGGAGGILAGYVTSTTIIFLPFVLLNHPPTLSSVAFYAIFAAGSIPLAILAGRFKWIGRACLALSGALALTVNLILSGRPNSLLPRLILLAILTTFGVVTTVILPLVAPSNNTKVASHCLILFTSLGSGSFLFGSAIELLSSKKLGWTDAVGLLVGEDIDLGIQNEWGKSVEFKGLLAACWIFGFFGLVWQLWRWREVGDDPDEQWNSYLGKLVHNDTEARFKSGYFSGKQRKGVFFPKPSVWQRAFAPSSELDDTHRPPSPLFYDDKASSPLTDLPDKKRHSREKDKSLPWEETGEERSKSLQRYGSHNAGILGDSDDDAKTLTGSVDLEGKDFIKVNELKFEPKTSHHPAIPRKQSTTVTLSGSTVVGSDHYRSGPKRGLSEESSSSESEEAVIDLEAGNIHQNRKKGMVSSISKMFGGQSRRPARYNGVDSNDTSRSFVPHSINNPIRSISRQSQHRPVSRASQRPAKKRSLPRTTSSVPFDAPSPKKLIPATPSLLRAIDRIQEAQRQARGEPSDVTEPASERRGTNDLWDNLDIVQISQGRELRSS